MSSSDRCHTAKADPGDAVVDYVDRYDWVTLLELTRHLEPFMTVQGDYGMTLDDPNLVVWAGMSEEYIALLKSLLSSRRLHAWPTSTLVYLIDGGGLALPVAKRPPRQGYRNPYWLPIALRTVPMSTSRRRSAA